MDGNGVGVEPELWAAIWPALYGRHVFQQDYQSRKYKSYRVNGCHRKLLDWSCLDLVEGLLFWFLLSDLAATWSRTSFFNYERNELSGIVLVHERSIRQAVTLGSKMGWPQSHSEVKLALSGSTELWLCAVIVVSLSRVQTQTKEMKEKKNNSSFNRWMWPTGQRHRQHISYPGLSVDTEIEITHPEDLFVLFTSTIKMFIIHLFLYSYIHSYIIKALQSAL